MSNFLCICQYGHSRSVALTRVFHALHVPAVAVGWMTSGNAIPTLAAWADHICIVDDHALHHVPQDQRHKVADFNIGPDRWSNPYNQELAAILLQLVEKKFPEICRGDRMTPAEAREWVEQSMKLQKEKDTAIRLHKEGKFTWDMPIPEIRKIVAEAVKAEARENPETD